VNSRHHAYELELFEFLFVNSSDLGLDEQEIFEVLLLLLHLLSQATLHFLPVVLANDFVLYVELREAGVLRVFLEAAVLDEGLGNVEVAVLDIFHSAVEGYRIDPIDVQVLLDRFQVALLNALPLLLRNVLVRPVVFRGSAQVIQIQLVNHSCVLSVSQFVHEPVSHHLESKIELAAKVHQTVRFFLCPARARLKPVKPSLVVLLDVVVAKHLSFAVELLEKLGSEVNDVSFGIPLLSHLGSPMRQAQVILPNSLRERSLLPLIVPLVAGYAQNSLSLRLTFQHLTSQL